ncbi:MAG: 3-hydroxyacyl-CoA dehydrogenase [Litorilinea sp.]|nr:MAG: 3-hydroxyacyl-CoA dehydrogenase [Litorilinea sp.]
MPYGIERATVIGAGTMGAAIAGHLANAGIPVTLLDIVPTELTPEEEAAGLTLEHPQVRNRIVRAGFERMVNASPSNLFSKALAARIELGNVEDDWERAVGRSDWIIEAIVERPGPKQALMARLDATAPATAIISSNTSGIPIHILAQDRSPEFKRRFLGTHFFNPPRYLHLLEVIPHGETDPAVVNRMRQFAENVLGKGVVVCKDTPNFIANRLLTFIQCDILEYAIQEGYTVEEVDLLTGTLLGRPRTATFRLNDVIGLDVLVLVTENLYPMIPHDEEREILRAPLGSAVLKTLLAHDLLGAKRGQGFYKTVVDEQGNKHFWGLDLRRAAHEGVVDYLPPQQPRWESVEAARRLPLPERLRALVNADDRAGALIWHTLSRTLAYASRRIPEIADSLVDVDNVMRWGFAWEMGPFEIWDALGVAETAERMEREGTPVAPWVREMLEKGHKTFYSHQGMMRTAYSPRSKAYTPIQENERVLRIPEIKRCHRTLAENDSATLVNMGDGVMLLEFHSKMNALDPLIFQVMQAALERLHGDAAGLVIGNEGPHFSVGANLVLLGNAAQSGRWDELEQMLKVGQDTLMALRTAPKPVVAAPFQRVLGGGVEVCMATDRVTAHAETYMGLVEVSVGIVPGWGGCKEMVRRHVSPHMHATNVNPLPYLRQVFETIGFAKVSTSALEAQELGYLSPQDRIVMNRDHLLYEAQREVLWMADTGYRPPVVQGNVYAAGRDALASMRIEIYSLQQAGYISEHDAKIADRLAYVLCGGELSRPTWMDEQYFLDLEREAILSLAGEEKTQARIWHMLQHGKPLRN